MGEYPKLPEYNRFLKWLKDAGVVFLVTALLTVGSELFLRLFFPQVLQGESVRKDSFHIRDKMLGLRYVPGAEWKFSNPEFEVTYKINQDGFRDETPHPMPKPENTFRVLLIGDSFTFGEGVSYSQTWPVLVEQELRRRGDKNIDFVKAGIQGMDTRSEFLLMRKLVKKYDCDAVVLVFLINDIYTNSLYGIPQESLAVNVDGGVNQQAQFKPSRQNSLWAGVKKIFLKNDRHSDFHLLTLAKRIAISSKELYTRLYLHSPRARYLRSPLTPEVQKKIKITEILLKFFADFCRGLDLQLIVVSMPQQFQLVFYKNSLESDQIDVRLYDKYFSKIARQYNFVWVETLTGLYQKIGPDNDAYFRMDGHLNPQGSKVFAQLFLEKVVPLFD